MIFLFFRRMKNMNLKRTIRFLALVVTVFLCLQAFAACDVSNLLGDPFGSQGGNAETKGDETEKKPGSDQDNGSSNRPPDVEADSVGLAFELYRNDAYVVAGIGTCTDKNIVIPSYYEGHPVVMIKDYAFYGCDIESVIIPDTVSQIGYSAFENCSSLSSVTIGNGVTEIGRGAFLACTQLKNIVIPNSVRYIGMSAFEACGRLASVSFGSGLLTIENYAFSLCGSLKEITVPDNVTTLGIGAFNACMGLKNVILGSGISTISEGLFHECYDLERVAFYSSVRSIESNAFDMCESLGVIEFYGSQADWDNISIQSGNDDAIGAMLVCKVVDEFDDVLIELELSEEGNGYVVVGIGSFTERDLVIPDTYKGLPVTEIGTGAFERCESLRSVVIPDSVVKIGSGAFANNSSLTHVTFGNGLVEIDDSAFMHTSLLRITIPDSVQLIDDNAFADCRLLDSVDLGEGIKAIGSYAFAYCVDLPEIIFPDSIEAVGFSAFEGCQSLATVGLHPDIIYMEDSFGDCDCLETVIFRGNPAQWAVLCRVLDLVDLMDLEVRFEDGNETEGTTGEEETPDVVDTTEEETPEPVETTEEETPEPVDTTEEETPEPVETTKEEETTVETPDGNEYSQGLEFVISGDGSGYVVLSIGDCSDVEIVIPSEYKGLPVTEIGEYAFSYAKGIVSVVVPDSVTYIGMSAFDNCTSLVSVYVPEGLEYIERKAFYNCSSLKEIVIGENVSYIGDNAFFGCSALEKVYYNAVYVRDLEIGNKVFACAGTESVGIELVVGNKVTKIPAGLFGQKAAGSSYTPNLKSVTFEDGSVCKLIGQYAFYGCSGITEMDIPDSVKVIGEYAFNGCAGIKTLTIGSGVEKLGSASFFGCYGIETLYFNAVDMYDFTEKSLVFAYIGKNAGVRVIVGKDVTRIPAYLLYNRGYVSYISSIEFEDGSVCTEIGDFAFSNAKNMTEIEIGETITYVAPNAFSGCTAVKTLYINAAGLGDFTFSDCFTSNLGTESGGMEVVFGPLVEHVPAYLLYNVGEYVTKVTFAKESVCKSIGEYAFYGLAVSELELPSTLVSIGRHAFADCGLITAITIPDNVELIDEYAFADCSALTDVTMGAKVDKIGLDIFVGCALEYTEYGNAYYLGTADNPYAYLVSAISRHIDSCEIHEDTKGIFPYAFSECSSIKEIVIPDGVTYIGDYAFNKCFVLANVTLGSGITAIPNGMFSECDDIESIVIPEGVKSIGASAFAYCERLDEITIPDGVTEIGGGAFYYCESLGSVTIPGSVEVISDNMFWQCRYLSSVTLCEGVREIGFRAFANCPWLESITIPDSIEHIDATAFYQSSYYASMSYTEHEGLYYLGNSGNPYAVLVKRSGNVTGETCNIHEDTKVIMHGALSGTDITSIVIPDGVVEIGDGAFEECTKLQSVVIGNGVKNIGERAFCYCESLTSVTFGKSLESIGKSGFSACYALEELVLPSGLVTIGEQAFASCNGLKTLVIPGSVKTMGYMAFTSCYSLENVTLEQGVESIGENAFYTAVRFLK